VLEDDVVFGGDVSRLDVEFVDGGDQFVDLCLVVFSSLNKKKNKTLTKKEKQKTKNEILTK
jgi:hypothetical protein